MYSVLSKSARRCNEAPSKFMAWFYLLATIYAIFYGISGLEKLVNLSTFDFNWYAGCIIGGTLLLGMQIYCWLRDY